MQIATVEIRSGHVVLASIRERYVYPKTYSNRTQAEKAAAKVGGQVGGRHPFLVLMPGPAQYQVGPLPDSEDLRAQANAKAIAVQEAILSADLDAVAVVSTKRLGRSELAPLVRKVFKDLGLKGISVTLPNYSMASTVEINMPQVENARADYVRDGVDYHREPFPDMPADLPPRVNNERHFAARRKLLQILDRAFPGCDDRSDMMTDYFDYKFSVN